MSVRDALWGRLFGGGPALGKALRKGIPRTLREARAVDRRVYTLPPEGVEKGRVLLAYIVRGFYESPGAAVVRSHTHYWEAMEIARAWAEQGFHVDVIDNFNREFSPEGHYDVVMGARMILESMAKKVKGAPLVVLHADTCHWLANNSAQLVRLKAIQDRRGVSLEPRKLIEVNRALECADAMTVLGNQFTIDSYAHRSVDTYRVPLSTVREAPWRDRDWETASRSFVWFGSQGLVHKGLDLVLEAFTALPDLHLYVCGPIDEERDFVDAYRTELYETPNIHTVGWVDVESREWGELVTKCCGVVFPSCAEGGAGSVLVCMHEGLIPIVTRSASVDIPDGGGVVLEEDSVEAVVKAVAGLAERPPHVLESMSREAWTHVRTHHTRAAFARRIREVVCDLATRVGDT